MSILRSAAKLAFAAADLFLRSPSGPRILIYHQVGAGLRRQMEVTVEDFEWQLDWLVDNREVVDLDTALRRWNEPGSDRLVVLSFDDGYADVHSTAFPALLERGFPFTLYLATAAVGRQTLNGAQPVNWDQIAEMAESRLLTVGGHTHRHTDLRKLTRAGIIEELETSNLIIESRLGFAPSHFAYPWGYWSPAADQVVREIYASAVLGAHSVRKRAEADRYLLRRFPIQLSDGITWFSARLGGGLLVEESIRRRIRGYSGP